MNISSRQMGEGWPNRAELELSLLISLAQSL